MLKQQQKVSFYKLEKPPSSRWLTRVEEEQLTTQQLIHGLDSLGTLALHVGNFKAFGPTA